MNILQISAPKSGSYWLHTILSLILEKDGIKQQSFIQKQPIYEEVKHRKLSFAGMAGVDMMDIEEDACYYRISSIFREKILDVQAYANATTLAWTHSSLCSTSFEVFPFFEKKICMVRDPRDRALSSAKFAFTDYMKEHYPTGHPTPEVYLEAEYDRLLRQWVWYVGNYLLHKQELDLHFVFYERLLLDFEKEFQLLLNYLEVSLSEKDREEIAQAVSFSNLKNESPEHLNKGEFGKWKNQLDEVQKQKAIAEAGEMLEILNYPIETSEEKLPKLPKTIPQENLKKILKKIDWKQLF